MSPSPSDGSRTCWPAVPWRGLKPMAETIPTTCQFCGAQPPERAYIPADPRGRSFFSCAGCDDYLRMEQWDWLDTRARVQNAGSRETCDAAGARLAETLQAFRALVPANSR